MKLYFSPGACSLSPHIVFREAGLDVAIEQVNLANKKTKSGADYRAINPKGSVPALELDDGAVLTEGVVIVQYLADRKPDSRLAPASGSMERYRLQEWLNYVATEVHKSFSPLFNPKNPQESKDIAKALLIKRFEFIDAHLATHAFLMGDEFSVADAYLFTVTRWAPRVSLDLSQFGSLTAYMERVAARPAVRAAMDAEGLTR